MAANPLQASAHAASPADYFPVQKYADSAALRKNMTLLFMNRGYPSNLALLSELLELRYEYATLLGFASWAEYAQVRRLTQDACSDTR